jgi:hypothetical protein
VGTEKLSRSWVPHFPFPAQKVARVEASTEMAQIRHESEESHFEGITTGGESWFQYSYASSKMSARSLTDVIPRMSQAIRTKKTMGTTFFTGRKTIVLYILAKANKFNQLYFVDYIFPI